MVATTLKDQGGLERLLPHHLGQLRASAIPDEVIAERGYRSATAATELRRLGFTDRQARTPTLLIPLREQTPFERGDLDRLEQPLTGAVPAQGGRMRSGCHRRRLPRAACRG